MKIQTMKKTLLATLTAAVMAGVYIAPSQAASTLFESNDVLTPTQAEGRFGWLEKCFDGLLLEVHDQMFDPTAPISNEQKLSDLKDVLLYDNGTLRSDAKYLTFGNEDNENPQNWFAKSSATAGCTTIPSDYGVSAVMVTPDLPQYCSAESRDKDYEYIKEVTFSNLTNASEQSFYSNVVGQAAKIYKDTSYVLTLTPGFLDGDTYNESWRVFIDWNGDGDFSDASENQYIGSSAGTITKNLTPPAGTVTGLTKMRITMDFFGGNSNACSDINSGEIEDYLVYIKQ